MKTFVAVIFALSLFTFAANLCALSLGKEGRKAANPFAILSSATLSAWAAWLLWGGAS